MIEFLLGLETGVIVTVLGEIVFVAVAFILLGRRK